MSAESQPESYEDYSIQEGFLVDVVFDESTKMQLPDKTYHQELLDQPISLENRIAHLIPYVEPTSTKYTANSIAAALSVDQNWVRRIADIVGIETVTEPKLNGGFVEIYPPLSLEILEEELDWIVEYRKLDDPLSSYAIGNFLARSGEWVESIASELEVYHTPKIKLPSGAMGYGYPKELVLQLRHIMLLTPHAGDRLTLDALSELTGRKKEWIGRRLKEEGIASDLRRSLGRGAIARHYPWESLEVINKIIENQPQAAGDWLTIGAMAQKLGKDYEWVSIRVKKQFTHMDELRLDDNRKPKKHFPPEVFQQLLLELETVKSYELAGVHDLALSALAKRVGHEQKWVLARLPYTSISSVTKLNPVNKRPLSYYSDEAENILLNLPSDILKTNNPGF